MSDIESIDTPPSKGGWPKGRPRKPVIETPDDFINTMRANVEADRERSARPVEANTARSGQRGEQRLSRVKTSDDKFHIPKEMIPDGMTYEWKRYTYGGKIDQDHQRSMMMQHWSAVPADRHPALAWTDSTSKYIEKEGLILMERPSYLTAEAHDERVRSADDQIRTKMRQLHADGKEKGFDKTSLQTGYDLSVADDE
jgi:hypothetical protein